MYRGPIQKHGSKTVPTTAEAITDANHVCQYGVYLYNLGAATVFIGGAGVTVGDGYPLPAGTGERFPVATPASLFCVSAAGGEDLRYAVI